MCIPVVVANRTRCHFVQLSENYFPEQRTQNNVHIVPIENILV